MAVKVGFKQPVLHDTVLLKFAFGKRLGHFLAHLARMIQNFPLVEFQKRIQLPDELFGNSG